MLMSRMSMRDRSALSHSDKTQHPGLFTVGAIIKTSGDATMSGFSLHHDTPASVSTLYADALSAFLPTALQQRLSGMFYPLRPLAEQGQP